jgi:hypothetical protein
VIDSVPPTRLRDALEPWCAAELSGALRVLDAPGGSVYILDGKVEYAECPVVSGVDRLLTASGRLSTEAWRAALAAGRTRFRVGDEIVAAGLISSIELESIVLLALYDAAHFLFDAAVEVRFEPGVRHPLGVACRLELADVAREVDRRKRLLIEAWPDASIDTAAVVPARRLPDQFVALTALQWEVVANADRRRSPIDLARLLGRDTYTVMLEVRRLAKAGLVEPGRPGGSAAAESVATVRARAVESTASVRARTIETMVSARTRSEPLLGPAPERPEPPASDPPVLEPLPRRVASTEAERTPPIGFDDECSEEILLRIRAGLAALR